jgi:hypothetical protein
MQSLTLKLLTGLALLTVIWVGAGVASAQHAGSRVHAPQRLAAVLSVHDVFAKPARASGHLGRVRPRRPLTGERTVLPVVGAKAGWLHVELPGRPNGHMGWISSKGTTLRTTYWWLVVHTKTRRVIVYHGGRAIRVFKGIVGKPSTPTPHGTFFVEESIQLSRGDVGAPFALALSARSTVLQQFDGGPGQIALHGLDNVGGTLGTAASHGCVRLADSAMRWLVGRIGPGVPVTITG